MTKAVLAGPLAKFQGAERLRFLRFLVVGISSTLIDFTLLTVLKRLGLSTLVANTISYSAGIVNGFVWNYLWTFAESRSKNFWHQFAQFALISLAGLLLSNGLILLLEAPLGKIMSHPEMGYIPAKVVATGVVVLWNFFANRAWTFNDVA